MLLNKRNRMVEGIHRSLVLLRSPERIEEIRASFDNSEDKRKAENRINRVLCLCLKTTFQKFNITPWYELPIQPKPGTLYSPSEEKKPDITLALNDDLNDGIYFHIECKRLGSSTSRTWKYNEEYVKNGIHRFTSETFRYGIDSNEGAMIGYIEDMESESILNEVNQAIDSQLKIATLTKCSESWQASQPMRLEHSFERPFEQSPFTLHHFWIDLKDCYPRHK